MTKTTETRKQIIEFIEPFMDKTLKFGCFIHNEDEGLFRIIITSRNELFEGDKILGHYDITAVLKYIFNKRDGLMATGYNDNIIYFSGFRKSKFEIPNKPLHLYTEEEEKDLLELLRKISV